MSWLAATLGRRPAASADAEPPVATGALPFEPTHYQRLRLSETCSAQDIDVAWHRVAPSLPPPLTARQRREAAITGERTDRMRADDRRLAYAVLSDPARRAVYDAWLARERAASRSWLRRLVGKA